jgi:hypothetical protein
MYKKVYRQEGGLAEEGFRAQIREAARKKIEDFNRRNRGEVAQRVRAKPNFIQRNIEPYKNKLYNKLANLSGDEERVQIMSDLRLENSNLKNPVYFPGESGTGLMSDLRHEAASNRLSQNLSPNIPVIGETIGDSLSFLGGGLRELKNMLPPILTGKTQQENLENWRATQEDLKANFKGTFGTDNKTTTTEDIYREGLNLPKQEQPLTREQFEQTLPEGYRPLNVTYEGYFDTPYDERVETRKGSYSGMPIILSPENANYFQTYFQGPDSQLHTRPEDRVNAFQPVATPVSMQNQQQGLPSLMKIVNEQQNPTPVTPSNATGFNSQKEAMADLRSKYPNVGLVAMPTQNADGSWSYQPPYDLDNPPPKPLGLAL